MKLITFCHNNHPRLGLIINNQITEIGLCLKSSLNLLEFLHHGVPGFQKLQQLTYNCTVDLNLPESLIISA